VLEKSKDKEGKLEREGRGNGCQETLLRLLVQVYWEVEPHYGMNRSEYLQGLRFTVKNLERSAPVREREEQEQEQEQELQTHALGKERVLALVVLP